MFVGISWLGTANQTVAKLPVVSIPLYINRVPAGFPSPTQDTARAAAYTTSWQELPRVR